MPHVDKTLAKHQFLKNTLLSQDIIDFLLELLPDPLAKDDHIDERDSLLWRVIPTWNCGLKLAVSEQSLCKIPEAKGRFEVVVGLMQEAYLPATPEQCVEAFLIVFRENSNRLYPIHVFDILAAMTQWYEKNVNYKLLEQLIEESIEILPRLLQKCLLEFVGRKDQDSETLSFLFNTWISCARQNTAEVGMVLKLWLVAKNKEALADNFVKAAIEEKQPNVINRMFKDLIHSKEITLFNCLMDRVVKNMPEFKENFQQFIKTEKIKGLSNEIALTTVLTKNLPVFIEDFLFEGGEAYRKFFKTPAAALKALAAVRYLIETLFVENKAKLNKILNTTFSSSFWNAIYCEAIENELIRNALYNLFARLDEMELEEPANFLTERIITTHYLEVDKRLECRAQSFGFGFFNHRKIACVGSQDDNQMTAKQNKFLALSARF